MSGKPYKNIYDIEKAREEYMKTLGLQSQINEMMLQANKAYKATGQLPPQSGLPDTRTAEEKLKDILFIKQSIKSDLSKIYDPQTVEMIIQLVEKSPLNSDGGLMRFLANRGQAYIADLLKKYKIGLGGKQDAEVFVKYLEAYFRDRRSDMEKLSYIPATTLTLEKFDSIIPQNQLLSEEEDRLRRFLLSEKDLEKIKVIRDNPEYLGILPANDIDYGNIQQKMIDYLDKLKTLPNTILLREAYNHGGVLGIVITNQDMNIKNDVEAILNHPNLGVKKATEEAVRAAPSRLRSRQEGRGLVDPETFEEEDVRTVPTKKELEMMDFKEVHKVYKMLKKLTKGELKWKKLSKSLTPDQKKEIMCKEIESKREKLDEMFPYEDTEEFEGHISFGKGMHGRGLTKKVFSTVIDKTKGVKPDPHYIRFGSLTLNGKKLKDNVLSIKTGSGYPIRGYSTRVVTPTFVNTINSIVGGKVPTYEDITKLSEDEKNYLYTISKKAGILDKLSVPAPSKDRLDKDIHRFEVLKGQIMAGNDNKEMVKEFKILINKLVKQNILPPTQSREILIDLLDLGY
jgi:hypothetical protein